MSQRRLQVSFSEEIGLALQNSLLLLNTTRTFKITATSEKNAINFQSSEWALEANFTDGHKLFANRIHRIHVFGVQWQVIRGFGWIKLPVMPHKLERFPHSNATFLLPRQSAKRQGLLPFHPKPRVKLSKLI
jgi:hypothetical protein